MIRMVATLTYSFWVFVSSAHAAIPKGQPDVMAALKTKPAQRWTLLKSQGKEGIKQLRQIAFGTQYTVEQRWKALSTLAMIAGTESEPELEKAVQSSDWFMRDAGLKALEKVNPPKAQKWAALLMSDPALVVRSSAVNVLNNANDRSVKGLLWEKLNSPQNFRGTQSLWVRGHIAHALSKFAEKGEESKFVVLLADKDTRLHKPATVALRRLTGVTPSKQNLKAEVSYWQNWWKSQNAQSATF